MASPMQRLEQSDPSPFARTLSGLRPHANPSPPDFGVHWPSPWEEFRSSVNSYLTGPHAPKDGEPDRNSALRVQWVEGKLPGRAFVASTLWHIAGVLLLLLPIWGFLPQTRPNLAPVHIELTFYPPVQDLPQIHLPGPASKPSPPGDPAKPLPQVGADAY